MNNKKNVKANEKIFRFMKQQQPAFWGITIFFFIITLVFLLFVSFTGSGPSTLLPEKCSFPVSLTCSDQKVDPTQITLVLQNGAKKDMNIQKISAFSDALGSGSPIPNWGCGCYYAPANGAGILSKGTTATFTLNTPDPGCPNWCYYRDTGRDKNRYNITLTYNWVDTPNITHQLNGEMLARRP